MFEVLDVLMKPVPRFWGECQVFMEPSYGIWLGEVNQTRSRLMV